jgi:asparagine synthase (glutamine-hydrolysing)
MSGFAAAFGRHSRKEIEAMMKKIAHRGPYVSGVYQGGRAILSQNYLRADGAVSGRGVNIPVRSANNPDLVIGYDGQIGNWAELAREHGIADGPFREERLLLALYEKYGPDMLSHLTDAIFTLVITDGRKLFAARGLLGIKTLFYARKGRTIYLASELKSILEITEDVREFPNGHYLDGGGKFTRFAELPPEPPSFYEDSVDDMTADIREIIERSFRSRIDFSMPTGGLLSGGMDSSAINYLGSQVYKEKFGQDARLKTFAIGVGESEDVHRARLVSRHIDSEHHELIVDLEQVLEALPEVIYHLESFDPSLVRSAVANYLISQYAGERGVQILLSGEGGDEIFCGYKYLGRCPTEELFARQMECLGYLHNNASLRLDRMNMCHSVGVVAPLISGELLEYSLGIPPRYKQKPHGNGKIEKWIFRKAYEKLLPEAIVWRSKQEFSQGSGSAGVLPAHFEQLISEEELAEAQAQYPLIRSQEELYYFRLFVGHFGDGPAVATVGQWHSL